MLTQRPLLFALQGSEHYATRVAQRLGFQLALHEERNYEDGEQKCRPLEPVNGREVVARRTISSGPGAATGPPMACSPVAAICATVRCLNESPSVTACRRFACHPNG